MSVEDYIRGYEAGLSDLDGPELYMRMPIIYEDWAAAAERSWKDPDWLDREVEERVRLREGRRQRTTPSPARESALPTPEDHVYVFQASDGRIKIGFTSGPVDRRRRAVEAAAGVRLAVLAQFNGNRDDELRLQARFAHSRIAGEWFTPDAAVSEWVEAGCPL